MADSEVLGELGSSNKVTVVFEWPPDKWVGFRTWSNKVAALLRVAGLLGLDEGRPSMTVVVECVNMEEEDQWRST